MFFFKLCSDFSSYWQRPSFSVTQHVVWKVSERLFRIFIISSGSAKQEDTYYAYYSSRPSLPQLNKMIIPGFVRSIGAIGPHGAVVWSNAWHRMGRAGAAAAAGLGRLAAAPQRRRMRLPDGGPLLPRPPHRHAYARRYLPPWALRHATRAADTARYGSLWTLRRHSLLLFEGTVLVWKWVVASSDYLFYIKLALNIVIKIYVEFVNKW